MKQEKITLGIDEAGRGCVLGPLVIGCVAAKPGDRQWFSKNRVRDSKKVPPDERAWLAEKIKQRCWFQFATVDATEIDIAVRDRTRTLNGLEMEHMSELLRTGMKKHSEALVRGYVDAPSINARGFTKKLIQACAWDSPLPLIAVHHADVNHLTVAAASIIAKDERERLIEELKKTLGIDFGCGYPHDQKTKEYLKVCPKNAAHVRWTWKTHLSYH